MRPLYLVGTNGDQIDLTGPEYCLDVDARFGTTRPRINYRSTIGGRRVQTVAKDVVLSTVAVKVTGTTVAEHDQLRSRLLQALRSVETSSAAPVALIVERYDGDRRVQRGYDLGDDSPVGSVQSCRSTVQISLESVEQPYWVSLDADVVATTIGVADSAPWTGAMPIGAAVPIGWPWSISGYFISDATSQVLTLPNPSSLTTWPEWSIEGPASSLELAHERTGKVIRWDGTLATGELLKIVTDPTKRSVTVDQANAWSEIAVRSEMSELLPGDNRVQVSLTGGTEDVTTVAALVNTRWVSI